MVTTGEQEGFGDLKTYNWSMLKRCESLCVCKGNRFLAKETRGLHAQVKPIVCYIYMHPCSKDVSTFAIFSKARAKHTSRFHTLFFLAGDNASHMCVPSTATQQE